MTLSFPIQNNKGELYLPILPLILPVSDSIVRWGIPQVCLLIQKFDIICIYLRDWSLFSEGWGVSLIFVATPFLKMIFKETQLTGILYTWIQKIVQDIFYLKTEFDSDS